VREADIRPAVLLAEYLRLSAADAETFFRDPAALDHRACPGCGVDDPDLAFHKNRFRLVTCGGCGTLYADPAPAPNRLDSFYADSPSSNYWANTFFPAVAEARRGRIFRPRVERILALMARLGRAPRRVIDVGAGAAVFLEEFRELAPDSDLRAVEPGHKLAAQCRDKGFETFAGFAEGAAQADGWRGTADLVASFEVIEHVAETVPFLAALGRLARPGGIVLVTGLTGDGFDIRALGAKSNAVCPPHHINFLSRHGVAALIKRAGLEEIEFFTPGQLDVDIVMNALADDPEAVADLALRNRLLDASPQELAQLQAEIAETNRSSHMWFVAQRPRAAA
jgi:SAM-dependent methyltransferase/ribosomal protein S27AE